MKKAEKYVGGGGGRGKQKHDRQIGKAGMRNEE